MTDKQPESESLPGDLATADLELRERREFLLSLGKWSKVVIGSVLLGGALIPAAEAMAWGNHGGGAGLWYNSGGWGGPPWGWYDGPRWRDGPYWRGRPYWRHRPYWRDYGWYDRPWYGRPWYNRPWYNGGWYNGWYNR